MRTVKSALRSAPRLGSFRFQGAAHSCSHSSHLPPLRRYMMATTASTPAAAPLLRISGPRVRRAAEARGPLPTRALTSAILSSHRSQSCASFVPTLATATGRILGTSGIGRILGTRSRRHGSVLLRSDPWRSLGVAEQRAHTGNGSSVPTSAAAIASSTTSVRGLTTGACPHPQAARSRRRGSLVVRGSEGDFVPSYGGLSPERYVARFLETFLTQAGARIVLKQMEGVSPGLNRTAGRAWQTLHATSQDVIN